MTLDQLEMIEAIVETGSFQAAAKKLFKSQPSLSNGVKKIEDEYNIMIFSREGYRPVLTREGRIFFESSQQTLSSFRHLHKLASEIGSGVESEISFAMDPILLGQRLNPIFELIKEKGQHTRLIFKSGILHDNLNRLKQEEVDFAVGILPGEDEKLVEKVKLCEVELVPVVSKNLISKKKLNLEQLMNFPNIVVASEDSQYSLVNSPKVWKVDSHARKIEFINLGLGWGRVSRLQYEQVDDLVLISENLVESVKLDFYFMRHKLKAYGPIGKKIWGKLSQRDN